MDVVARSAKFHPAPHRPLPPRGSCDGFQGARTSGHRLLSTSISCDHGQLILPDRLALDAVAYGLNHGRVASSSLQPEAQRSRMVLEKAARMRPRPCQCPLARASGALQPCRMLLPLPRRYLEEIAGQALCDSESAGSEPAMRACATLLSAPPPPPWRQAPRSWCSSAGQRARRQIQAPQQQLRNPVLAGCHVHGSVNAENARVADSP